MRCICFVTFALFSAGARKKPINRELRNATCSAFRRAIRTSPEMTIQCPSSESRLIHSASATPGPNLILT